jgi:cell filamentation protein
MENRRRRYLNFDLDSAGLRETLGGENGRKRAYGFIKTYMLKNGFEHRQGSAYMSGSTLSDAEVYDLTDSLVRQYPWLAQCAKGYDVTNVGATHDYLFVLRQYKDENAAASDDDLLAL